MFHQMSAMQIRCPSTVIIYGNDLSPARRPDHTINFHRRCKNNKLGNFRWHFTAPSNFDVPAKPLTTVCDPLSADSNEFALHTFWKLPLAALSPILFIACQKLPSCEKRFSKHRFVPRSSTPFSPQIMVPCPTFSVQVLAPWLKIGRERPVPHRDDRRGRLSGVLFAFRSRSRLRFASPAKTRIVLLLLTYFLLRGILPA